MSKGQPLHWARVGRIIQQRMDQRSLSEPELADQARMSLNTLKGILEEAEGKGPGRHHVSYLFALDGPLGFPRNYLVRILDGVSPDEMAGEVENWSTLEVAFRASLLDTPEKSGELLEAMASMKYGAQTVLRIAREITEGENPAS